MESNEKKPKRPRIRTAAPAPADLKRESDGTTYERFNYNDRQREQGSESHYTRPGRPYQPRYTGNNMSENGYQPRSNSYGQRDHYQPREPRSENGYSPRHNSGYSPRSNNGYAPRGNNGYTPRQDGYENNYGAPRPQRPRYNSYDDKGQRRGSYHQGNFDNRQQGFGFDRPQEPRGYGNQRPYNNGNRHFNGGPRRPGQNSFNPQQRNNFAPHTPKPVTYEMPIPDPNEKIRLNKFMANSGICSRREADEYIQKGMVKVNGQVVTELGTKISHSDNVEFDEKLLALENKTYILLNKPKNCVTTSDDPNGRLTVLDLVKGACNERIYPVGRLDRNTTGVLLLTNDGDLASKLTHPKFVKKKIYHVWCDRNIEESDMQAIADGIELEDGMIHADAISYATPTDRDQAGIEIHSGQNRIVRRIFEKLGYHITKLDRVYFAGLTKKNLPRGRWRYLTQTEVNMLKQGAFE